MKTDDVPQDQIAYYHNAKKAIYAQNSGGNYTAIASTGWAAEAAVTSDAVAEFRRLAEIALTEVQRGEKSPLWFHMWNVRMDLPTLAGAAGTWQWRVKRHFKPTVFAKLPAHWYQHYADALGLTPEALRQWPQ